MSMFQVLESRWLKLVLLNIELILIFKFCFLNTVKSVNQLTWHSSK